MMIETPIHRLHIVHAAPIAGLAGIDISFCTFDARARLDLWAKGDVGAGDVGCNYALFTFGTNVSGNSSLHRQEGVTKGDFMWRAAKMLGQDMQRRSEIW
nr:hypothetical protein [Massilia aquatica]